MTNTRPLSVRVEPGEVVMARTLLRSRWVTVPNLVGQRVDDASLTAREAGVELVAETVDGRRRPIALVVDWRVVAQRPCVSVQVRRKGQIVAVVERGGDGSAGVREPRRPLPVRRTDAGEADLTSITDEG